MDSRHHAICGIHTACRYVSPWYRINSLTKSNLAFSAMRARALSGSNAFAALILLLSLGPVGANMVCAVFSSEYASS